MPLPIGLPLGLYRTVIEGFAHTSRADVKEKMTPDSNTRSAEATRIDKGGAHTTPTSFSRRPLVDSEKTGSYGP